MPRKASAVLTYKLRIREALRRRIEQAAKKREVSLNYEMATRLERSFDEERLVDIDATARLLQVTVARLSAPIHELNLQGDLLRAAEVLVRQVENSERDEKAIAKAVEKVKQAIRVIELEAKQLPRKMHTAGAV
jgi:hypothetical protein